MASFVDYLSGSFTIVELLVRLVLELTNIEYVVVFSNRILEEKGNKEGWCLGGNDCTENTWRQQRLFLERHIYIGFLDDILNIDIYR